MRKAWRKRDEQKSIKSPCRMWPRSMLLYLFGSFCTRAFFFFLLEMTVSIGIVG